MNLIEHVISAAHAKGKWVGMCGEMAEDEKSASLLLGLGLDEFSMSASSILAVRKLFKQLDVGTVAEHSGKILSMNSNDEVLRYLHQFL